MKKIFISIIFYFLLFVTTVHTQTNYGCNVSLSTESKKSNLNEECVSLGPCLCSSVATSWGPNCSEPFDVSNIFYTCFNEIEIPVRVILIGNSNSNSSFNSIWQQALLQANIIYADINVSFFVHDIEIISDSDLANLSIEDDGNMCSKSCSDIESDGEDDFTNLTSVIDQYDADLSLQEGCTSGLFNLIFVESLNACDPDNLSTGVASFPGNDYSWAMVSSLAITLGHPETTLIHELGHAFGLLHTFSANFPGDLPACCDGDLIGDTPTSPPNLEDCYERGTLCLTVNECLYEQDNGICQPNHCTLPQVDGQELFENFMSYTGQCRTKFTAFQQKKMRNIIEDGCAFPNVCIKPELPIIEINGMVLERGDRLTVQPNCTLNICAESSSGSCMNWSFAEIINGNEIDPNSLVTTDDSNCFSSLTSAPNSQGFYFLSADVFQGYNNNCMSRSSIILEVSDSPNCDITCAKFTQQLEGCLSIGPKECNDQDGWDIDVCLIDIASECTPTVVNIYNDDGNQGTFGSLILSDTNLTGNPCETYSLDFGTGAVEVEVISSCTATNACVEGKEVEEGIQPPNGGCTFGAACTLEPSDFSLSSNNTTSITATWTADPTASGYQIEWSYGCGNPIVETTTLNGAQTTYTNTGLVACQEICAVIQAVCSDGSLGPPQMAAGIIEDDCDPDEGDCADGASNFFAEVQSNIAVFSWTANNGLNNYEFCYGVTAGDCNNCVNVGTNNFYSLNVSDLNCPDRIYYKIITYCDDGSSNSSSESSLITNSVDCGPVEPTNCTIIEAAAGAFDCDNMQTIFTLLQMVIGDHIF